MQTYIVTTNYLGWNSFRIHYQLMAYAYTHKSVLYYTFSLNLLIFFPNKLLEFKK